MTDRRIIDLQEGLSNDAYLLTDSVTNGTKKYAVSDMIDRAADTALNEVGQIISQASSAAAQATDAKNAAQAATTTANNAATAANNATTAANAAIAAIGDILEQAVPLMSADTRGGAKLGSGLQVEDGALSIGGIVKSGNPVQGCALASVEAQGWAEQESTTGKNLLNANANYTKVFAGGSSDEYASVFNIISGVSNVLTAHIGEELTFSADAVSSVQKDVYLYTNKPAIKRNTFTLSSTPTRISITLTPEETNTTFTIGSQDGIAATVTLSNVQFEAGSTATSYEPYTGGLPAPSPEYEMPIEVCRGRNLLDLSGYPARTHNGVTYSYDGSTLMASGTASGASYNIGSYSSSQQWMTKLYGGTYTLSFDNPSITAALDLFSVSTGTKTTPLSLGASGRSFAVSEESYAVLTIQAASGITINTSIHFQLEQGSTPTPYVPYGHVGLEVQGRNLYTQSARPAGSTYNTAGVTRTMLNESSFVVNGTLTANNWCPANSSTVDPAYFVTLPPGDYVASCSRPGLAVRKIEDGSNVAINSAPYDAQTFAFTLEEETQVCITHAGKSDWVYDNEVVTLQLERGSTPTDYEPYLHTTTPIPLPLKSDGKRWAGGLPDGTADALSLDSAGKWEWGIGTGLYAQASNVDSVSAFTSITNGARFYVTVDGLAARKGANGDAGGGLADIARYHQDSGGIATYGEHVYAYENRIYYVLGDVADAAGAVAFVNAHPITVLYPLATPTIESGYIDLPEVSEGCTVSIPELKNFNMHYIIEPIRPIINLMKETPHFKWVTDDNKDTWLAIIV